MVLQQTRAPCNKIMKYRKFFCFLLACSVLSTAVPATAFARTNSTQAVETEDYSNQDGKKECQIEAEMASDFAVTVPKRIILDGESKSGSYTVGCTGDIAGNETVSVQPSVTFPMEQTGKSAVDAEVTQAKTVFRSKGYNSELSGMEARIGTDNVNGSIAADGLSAGVWNGNLTFTIALNEEEIIENEITLQNGNLAAFKDLNGNPIATEGDVVIPEYVKAPSGQKFRVTGLAGSRGYNSASNVFGSVLLENGNVTEESAGKKVTSVTLPKSIKSIGEYAFYGCGLTSVNVPSSVTSIGNYAFYECTNLLTADTGRNVTDLGSEVFEKCASLKSVKMHDGITTLKYGVFRKCDNLESVELGNTVKEIGVDTFFYDGNLKSVNIPDSVETIRDSAFSNCKSLVSVTFGSGIKTIEKGAFRVCTSLQTLDIPDGVTNIGDTAFYGCSNLTSVHIPNGLKNISNDTFSYCTSLQSVAIPKSVTTIGLRAFNNTALTSAVFEKSSGWTVDNSAINSSEIADPATAATYLKTSYVNSAWVRSGN